MTGQTLIIALAVAAAVVVLVWTVVDCRRYNTTIPTAHLFDQDGRLIGATEDLPLYQGGRHRAVRSR